MAEYCTYCGMQLEEGAKLCTGCGRIVGIDNASGGAAQYTQRRTQAPRRVYEHPARAQRQQAQHPVRQRPPQQQRTVQQRAPQQRPQQQSQTPHRVQRQLPEEQAARHRSRKKSSKTKTMVKKAVLTAVIAGVIIAAVYFVLAFVNITLIKHSGYDFDVPMELEQDNYGDAVEVYFKDGSWSFNLFTFTVSYEGKANNGDKYEMSFGHEDGQTVVTELRVNGKKIRKKDIMPLYIMGMFNSVEIKTDK